VAGCSKSPSLGSSSASTAPAGILKAFPVKGKVLSVDTAKGSIMLDSQAVPGFMDAMTMPYTLKNPAAAGQLHSGDLITAKILVHQTADGFEDDAVLDDIAIAAPMHHNSESAAP
jgi:protein SCO1/2